MLYYQIYLHKTTYSENNIVFDSLSDSNLIESITEPIQIERTINKANECVFKLPSIYTNIFERGHIIEIRGSEDINSYKKNILFTGVIYNIEQTRETSTITAHGFISLLNNSYLVMPKNKILNGWSVGDIIYALFKGSSWVPECQQLPYLYQKNIPFDVVNISRSNILYTETNKKEGIIYRMDLLKDILNFIQNTTDNTHIPIIIEKGWQVIITDINIYSSPFSIEEKTNSEYINYSIKNNSDYNYNAIVVSWKNQEATETYTYYNNTDKLPLYKIITTEDKSIDKAIIAKKYYDNIFFKTITIDFSRDYGFSLGDIVSFKNHTGVITEIIYKENKYTVNISSTQNNMLPLTT